MVDYLTIKFRANFGLGTELSVMVTSPAVESARQRLPVEGPQESPDLPISLIRPPSTAPQRLGPLLRQAAEMLGLLNLAIRKSFSAMPLKRLGPEYHRNYGLQPSVDPLASNVIKLAAVPLGQGISDQWYFFLPFSVMLEQRKYNSTHGSSLVKPLGVIFILPHCEVFFAL